MFRNYLMIAFRNIRKEKAFSLINIFGLAIGLSASILLILFIHSEFSYDQYHENANQIFRVATEFHGHNHAGLTKTAITRCPLAPALLQEVPEVLNAARIKTSRNVKLSIGERSFHVETIYFTDPALFKIFTLPVIVGNQGNHLNHPQNIIISEKIARKFFGSEDPIGKTIQYMDEFEFVVSAVIADMPANSHFIMDIILPIEAYAQINNSSLTDWRRSSGYTYLLLSKDSNPEMVVEKMEAVVQKYDPRAQENPGRHRSSLFLQPLLDIHLHSQMDGEISPNSDINTIYLFSGIALLILIIACFNYMNLATAQSTKRGLEVGIRKTIGADKIHILKQFLGESLIITFFALLVALLLVDFILPVFNTFMGTNLALQIFRDFQLIIWLIGLTAGVALIAGMYPAFLISAFNPLKIISGLHTPRKKNLSLRNLLVVMQFAISIILIISTLIIREQLEYIINKDVGYQREQIVTVKIRGADARTKLDLIKSELEANPNIMLASSSTYLPNWIRDQTSFNWPGKPDDLEVPCYVSFVDYNYTELYGIQITQGRNFSKEHPSDANGAFLINERALKELGWEDPLMKELIHWDGTQGKVVGVVKDFNFHSLHRHIEPLYLYFEPLQRNYFLSLKISGNNIPETLEFIEEKISFFDPKYPFEYHFFNEIFDKMYKAEQRMQDIFIVFAAVAIFISCLGLFGLSLFTVQTRTKEIGIRKVLGAGISEIVFMLSQELTRWVILANIIAWPVAWLIMDNWLQNFAYQLELGWLIFIVSGTIALSIALITVSIHTLKAAILNPVDALRYE